jgi:hypothetical protein
MRRFFSQAAAIIVAMLVTAPCSLCFGAVTIDWAYVGNAGNAPDDTGY